MTFNFTLDEMISKTNKREAGFRMMIEHLKSIENPLIIETGCARPPDIVPWGTVDIFFKDDGVSTAIFDRFINDFGGDFHSVDLTPRHTEYAKSIVSEKSQVHCDDSIGFLWHVNKILTEENRYVDLLYLDSYDYEASDPYPSMVHHIKEIAVILSRMRPGSMLAVDDNVGTGADRTGKPKYVAEMLEAMGIPLIHEGQQLIWKF
jgi:hypothetical protein